ncbi:MAG: hypothetical protein ACE14V_00640 [bacterium]
MNRKKLITNSILIIIIFGLLGYYYFFMLHPAPKSSMRMIVDAKAKQKLNALSEESIAMETTASPELRVETSFDGTNVIQKVYFRGIGSRNLFTPLIPPPPPPKPRERGVNELTINWVLEEIVDPTQAIISDTRRESHQVTTGDEINGIKIGSIEETGNRVELRYKEESKWLVLQDIETVTRGWKLDGVSPDTKEAYVSIERHGSSITLSEGTTFDHIRLESVNDDGVTLSYGTQKRTVKMGGM